MGYPRTTLYEFHRVLRPGGYLIIRQMGPNPASTLVGVHKFAAKYNWTTVFNKPGCHVEEAMGRVHMSKDTILAFRMPLPAVWKQTAYDTSWFG